MSPANYFVAQTAQHIMAALIGGNSDVPVQAFGNLASASWMAAETLLETMPKGMRAELDATAL